MLWQEYENSHSPRRYSVNPRVYGVAGAARAMTKNLSRNSVSNTYDRRPRPSRKRMDALPRPPRSRPYRPRVGRAHDSALPANTPVCDSLHEPPRP